MSQKKHKGRKVRIEEAEQSRGGNRGGNRGGGSRGPRRGGPSQRSDNKPYKRRERSKSSNKRY